MAPALCTDQTPVPRHHTTAAQPGRCIWTPSPSSPACASSRCVSSPFISLNRALLPPSPPAVAGCHASIARNRSCYWRSCAPVFRLSYQEVRDGLVAWSALALACGFPRGRDGRVRVRSLAQQSKRLRTAGAPSSELLFVLLVRAGLWMGLTRGRDLIIDSAPILAWRRADPDAAFGHAPAHHPRPRLARVSAAHPALPRDRPAAPVPAVPR